MIIRDIIHPQMEKMSAPEAVNNSRSHVGQLWDDTMRFHARTDGPIETIGAPFLITGAIAGKVGNALVGDAGDFARGNKGPRIAPIPLGEGGLKYTTRDVKSLVGNTADFGWNVITLHPIRAIGNAAKGAFDALDIVTFDPALDILSAAAGHSSSQRKNSAKAPEYSQSA